MALFRGKIFKDKASCGSLPHCTANDRGAHSQGNIEGNIEGAQNIEGDIEGPQNV